MPENAEHERYSQVAADAVSAALQFARSKMDDASDARLLLMIIGNAAACLGRLRVESNDVLRVVYSLYEQGAQMPSPPGNPPRFDLDD